MTIPYVNIVYISDIGQTEINCPHNVKCFLTEIGYSSNIQIAKIFNGDTEFSATIFVDIPRFLQ